MKINTLLQHQNYYVINKSKNKCNNGSKILINTLTRLKKLILKIRASKYIYPIGVF